MDQFATRESDPSFLTIEQWTRKIEEALEKPNVAGPLGISGTTTGGSSTPSSSVAELRDSDRPICAPWVAVNW